jgi:hypothetical protein
VFTITYLAGFPYDISHNSPPYVSLRRILRPQRQINPYSLLTLFIESTASGPGYPVTGITNHYDNSRNLDNKTPQKLRPYYFFSRRRSSPNP